MNNKWNEEGVYIWDSFPHVGDKLPHIAKVIIILRGCYAFICTTTPHKCHQGLGLINTPPLSPLHHQEWITIICDHALFTICLQISKSELFGPTFAWTYANSPLYWYNVDLGPECLICLALEVIDEGGGSPCLDHAHHMSSPQSNRPQTIEKRCHVWNQVCTRWVSAPSKFICDWHDERVLWHLVHWVWRYMRWDQPHVERFVIWRLESRPVAGVEGVPFLQN